MRPWLSPAGTASALAVGAAAWAGAGWRGVVLLFVFLVSASLLTPGGGRRRPAQVLANGSVAAVCALLSREHPALLAAFAGAVAAAAADTWSTEAGGRSGAVPRLITSGRPVPRGTSGGITLPGTLAGLLGGITIAAAAWGVGLAGPAAAAWIAAGGAAGSLGDSLLGATVQARWRCPACDALGETRRDACGIPGVRASGIGFMTNDAVNVAATLIGAVVAYVPVFLSRAPLP